LHYLRWHSFVGASLQRVPPHSHLCREQFFEKEISTIRKRELKFMTKNAIIKTINITMVFGTPPTTACVIFAAYEMMVGRLAATLAFTTLSLFNILRFPLVVLPKAMRALSEALAAIVRIEAFLIQAVPTDTDGVTKTSRPGTSIVRAGDAMCASSMCAWLRPDINLLTLVANPAFLPPCINTPTPPFPPLPVSTCPLPSTAQRQVQAPRQGQLCA
jgi:hypothetical protein